MIGIYKITNPKGKVYIGQSINIKKRFSLYKNKLCPSQRKLHNSLCKYGAENHKYEIITECKSSQLDDMERYYINVYDSNNCKNGLNLMSGGNRNGSHSEETKNKIRNTQILKKIKPPSWKGKKHNEETKHKISLSNKGRVFSEEHCEKISLAAKGRTSPRKGCKVSEETRLLMSESAKKRKRICGHKHSEETKRKISESLKKRAKMNKENEQAK